MSHTHKINQWQEDLIVALDRQNTQGKKVVGWAREAAIRVDSDHLWLLPVSIVAMFALALALLPLFLWHAVWGLTLVMAIQNPARSYHVYRVLALLGRFVGCAVMCVLIHALFIYMGWEAALETLIGE